MPSELCLELAPNQDLELQTNRSRKLLGVWCWDWYQNKAGELYFLFFLYTFIVIWFSTSMFSKNKTSTSQNVDISRFRSNVDLPKMLDKNSQKSKSRDPPPRVFVFTLSRRPVQIWAPYPTSALCHPHPTQQTVSWRAYIRSHLTTKTEPR